MGAGGRPRTTVVVVPLAVLGGRDWRAGFCDSGAGLGWRAGMYVFMVFAFRFIAVWGVSPTTCGSATPLHGSQPTFTPESRCTPLSLSIASHIVVRLQSERKFIIWKQEQMVFVENYVTLVFSLLASQQFYSP